MTTVRLDTATESVLRQLTLRRGQTKSEVIRDAIGRLAEEEVGASAYDRLRPFLGVADSGGMQLSTESGRQFRELLQEKRRARRSG